MRLGWARAAHRHDGLTLNDKSITALALEESLLREWSLFNARVAELDVPATRADADRMQRFANHGSFADSVVDALGLHLAGQNTLDRKLLHFLDLVLIQRAQPDDLTILMKVAERYSGQKDLPALLTLVHQLRLYEERPSLGGATKFCAELLSRFDVPCDNIEWARLVGIQPQAENWHASIRLGTASPEFWVTRKSALKPQDTSLELLVTAPGQWRVQIARLDRLYSAQWRPAGITVDTDAAALKAIGRWPKLAGHAVFPAFATTLAHFLKVQWHRAALITVQDAAIDEARLLDWLHSCADALQR